MKKINIPFCSNKGFTTIFLVTILPLLLCCILFLYVSSFHILLNHRAHSICRVGLLKGQSSVSKKLSLLWKTNQPAETLILLIQLLRAAEIGEVISGYGILALPKTEETLRTLQKIQNQLGNYQRFLKVSAKFESLRSQLETANEINKLFKKIHNLMPGFISFDNDLVIPNLTSELKIHPKYLNESASPYDTDFNYFTEQQSKIQWFYTESVNSNFNKWLVFSHHLFENCAATSLYKGTNLWAPTLI
jgi:hypothetical protein